jgi:hypothetical protein
VSCNPGERAVGGGVLVTAVGSSRNGEYGTAVMSSAPTTNGAWSNPGETPNGWFTEATNNSGSSGATSLLQTYVICVA